MNVPNLTLACLFCTSLLVVAQSPEKLEKPMPSEVIGGVSDGKPSPPAPPKKLPDFKINWSRVHQKKDQKFVINRIQAPPKLVQQPAEPLDQEKLEQRAREIEQWVKDIKESGGFFTVSATIYDHKTTHVRWWNGKKEYACYSNIDWNHLGGFHEFVGRGKRFNMIMFSGNTSTKRMREEKQKGYRDSLPDIPRLPNLATHGARYMVVKGDENNDEAMEFIEAIHDLYDEHRDTLVKACRERERHRKIRLRKQEELKRNPPPKKDIVINYWRKKNAPKGQQVRPEGKEVTK